VYGALFDWTFEDSGEQFGHYTQAFANGKPVAAVVPKMPGMNDNTPTAWTVYFGASDADATAARIKELGGTILWEPMTVGDLGRMCVATDPQGAVFGLWQPMAFNGAALEGEHGAMCWSEVNSNDAKANVAFYTGVFGLSTSPMDGGPSEYHMLENNGQPVAGVLQMTKEWDGIPPHWMAYFAVANLEKANDVFTEHGGKLLHGPIPSPYGRIMVVQDPQGAVFSYMAA